jgi:hypothetical protein
VESATFLSCRFDAFVTLFSVLCSFLRPIEMTYSGVALKVYNYVQVGLRLADHGQKSAAPRN